MEGNNTKLQDINGIPLLKWYLPNKKDKDETNNIEEIIELEKEDIETVRNEIIQPELSSSNVDKCLTQMCTDNLALEESFQENSKQDIELVLQSSEHLSNNAVYVNDSSMQDLGGSEMNSMSYNLRERSNKKNDSKQENPTKNVRQSPYKERRGRKRKIPNETSPTKYLSKSARKSLFNELQTSYLNKTSFIKKIKCDLIEKEVSLKKIKKTLSKWMNSECSPLERFEALSLLENVKSIQQDLSMLKGKLKLEKLSENRKLLKKEIDDLTSLSNKIKKQLIDIIVECDIQHERLTEEINDINNIFPNIVSIDQSTSNQYYKKSRLSKQLFEENSINLSQSSSIYHQNNITATQQMLNKEINKNGPVIIFPPNEMQTINQYETKYLNNVRSEQAPRKNRQQRKPRKPKCLITRLKKSQNLLNQTVKSLAKLTLTNQQCESPVPVIRSNNLTSGIIGNVSYNRDSEINTEFINSPVTNPSQIVGNSSTKKRSDDCYVNQTQKSDLGPSLNPIIPNTSYYQNNNLNENKTLQTSIKNSADAETINSPNKPFVQHSIITDSLKKPTVPMKVNLNKNSPLPIKLNTVNLILKQNSKSLVHNKCNNNENRYGKCFVKMLPLKSTTIKRNEPQRTINLKINQEIGKISANIIDECKENCNTDFTTISSENLGEGPSEMLSKTVEMSPMNDVSNLKRSIDDIATRNLADHDCLLSDSQNVNIEQDIDSSNRRTSCQDSLLELFDTEEILMNDDYDCQAQDDGKQLTSTETQVQVKHQETQTILESEADDSTTKFEQFFTRNTMSTTTSSSEETQEIFACINSIKTIRIKSEHDFVPINDLTNLIAADDFTWHL